MRTQEVKTAVDVNEGTIFVASWGYDQTNIDFYQVIDRTAKMVTVRKLRSKGEYAYTMARYVMPLKDQFLDSDHPYDQAYGKPFKRRLIDSPYGVYFNADECSTARIWDGERRTETSTG